MWIVATQKDRGLSEQAGTVQGALEKVNYFFAGSCTKFPRETSQEMKQAGLKDQPG